MLRGTPAAVDDQRDPGARRSSCRLAQGAEERWIEVGETTVPSLATLPRRTTVLTARDIDG